MDQDILGQQLLRACRHGDVDEVKRLLEEGAPVSWTNWSGSTALGTACCCDRADVIKVLLEYKADINEQTSNGLTPLHIACTLGKMESVRALVSTGKCKLRVLNSYGRTPLGEAVFWNKLSIVEHMINACNIGINDTVTKWGDTALGLAVRQEKLDIVKYFISRFSMNINVPVTRWGDTLMELTIREQKLDILKYLISECIVNVNTPINDFEETPLLLAARGGKLSVIKFLISECGADVNDKLLLLASKYGHTEMVSYLLIMHHLNPNFKDVNGQTPLVLARKKDVIQLLLQHGAVALDVYTEYRKTLGKVFSKDPLKNLAKMFVIGRSGEGKSTLIEAIEHEPTVLESLVNVFISRREVDGVSLKTAGIIPRTFKSRFFGQVVMYDFAGQDAYYSSHAAIIKSAVDTCSPIIVLVVGLHRDDTTITHSVSYWLGIIANQCANLDGKAPLIVVGSHADLVTDMATVDRKEQLILRTAQRFSIFNLVKCVRMDCRYSNSTSMRAFRRYIGTCCSTIQSKWSVSLNSHMLLVYMLDKFAGSIAITLEELCANIKTSQELSKEIDFLSFVPTTIPRLIDICTQLSDKGHILFLHNTLSPDTSFIVIDTAKLLAEINGTIFAPEDFTQHCEMSTSTGVVSLSKLATHFANLHIEMLIGFLSHLELAVPIEDNEILSLIDQHFSSTEEPVEYIKESYVFCPALIRLKVPNGVYEYRADRSYHFGWILCCVDNDDFFDARFLHVLILRLSLSFGLAPELAVADVPTIQRRCSVWTTGVCWATPQGVKVLVEVVAKKNVAVFIQANSISYESLKLRSAVIKKVLETSNKFCQSINTREYLLPPANVSYPLDVSQSMFSLASIALRIVNQDPCVVSTTGIEPLAVSELLQAEVYADVGENILQLLFNESNPEYTVKISDQFLSIISSCWSKHPMLLKIIFSAIANETKNCYNGHNLEDSLKAWRDNSNTSYKSLRQVLDPLSVFSGRSPLELAGIPGNDYSEDLLISENAVRQPTISGKIAGKALTIEELKRRTRVSDTQLDAEIIEHDIQLLAGCFDNVDDYLDQLGLTAGQQTDVKDHAYRHGTESALREALRKWRERNPYAATFRTLVNISLELCRGGVADRLCKYISDKVPGVRNTY